MVLATGVWHAAAAAAAAAAVGQRTVLLGQRTVLPSALPIHDNLYGMSVSFTDFHPFKLLTGVHLKSYGL